MYWISGYYISDASNRVYILRRRDIELRWLGGWGDAFVSLVLYPELRSGLCYYGPLVLAYL